MSIDTYTSVHTCDWARRLRPHAAMLVRTFSGSSQSVSRRGTFPTSRRRMVFYAVLTLAAALAGASGPHPRAVSRRSLLARVAFAPCTVHATTAGPISDYEVVEAQQAKGEKIDLNNAIVVDYKRLPGFYPGIAGLIASSGPYKSVDDALKIRGMTPEGRALINKYRSELTVLPPGRGFAERINQRQST